MRVFIPGRVYDDSFADNVQITLVGMGHEVLALGRIEREAHDSMYRYAARKVIEHVRRGVPSGEDSRMLKLCKEYEPDLFLSTTTSVHPEILAELGRTCRGRRAIWWGDPPANSERWGILDPGWDFVFLKDRAAVNKLRLAGRNAFLLHEAMNPAWHRPVSGQRNQDVVIAGNYYAFRQAMALRLVHDGVRTALYGPPPPRWAHRDIKKSHTGRYIVREEKSRIFGEGMACLNTFSLAEGDALNCRAFEIAGCGGLQLIEHRDVIGECFEPNKELLVFRTYEELVDHIRRASLYPREMSAIRNAGARRAVAEHTYEHRLRAIFRTIFE